MGEHGLRVLIALIAGVMLILAGINGTPGSMIASIIDAQALNKTG